MAHRKVTVQPFRRLIIQFSIANELWYSSLKEGGKRHHFIECGYYKSIEHEGCYSINLIFFWASIKVAFDISRTQPQEAAR